MKRRETLAALGLLGISAGCLRSTSERNPGTEASTNTEDCWPQFCEGSTMVEVIVNADFSGEVVLEPSCRAEEITVQSGQTKTVIRQSDAETCDVVLTIDEQEVFNRTIQDYESTTLRVGSNGEVTEETVEL